MFSGGGNAETSSLLHPVRLKARGKSFLSARTKVNNFTAMQLQHSVRNHLANYHFSSAPSPPPSRWTNKIQNLIIVSQFVCEYPMNPLHIFADDFAKREIASHQTQTIFSFIRCHNFFYSDDIFIKCKRTREKQFSRFSINKATVGGKKRRKFVLAFIFR